MIIIYAKRRVLDPVFEYIGTVETGEECAEKLYELADFYDALSYVEINNHDLTSRRFEFNRSNKKGGKHNEDY